MHLVTTPVDAVAPGVDGHATLGILQMQLPRFAPGISGEQRLEHRLRREPIAQQAQSARPIHRIDQCLRGQRADLAIGMRTERTDRKETDRDGNAESAGNGIAGNDRLGHVEWDTGSSVNLKHQRPLREAEP